jgi:uncharacterized membrane protein YhaH (DUF805 family)
MQRPGNEAGASALDPDRPMPRRAPRGGLDRVVAAKLALLIVFFLLSLVRSVNPFISVVVLLPALLSAWLVIRGRVYTDPVALMALCGLLFFMLASYALNSQGWQRDSMLSIVYFAALNVPLVFAAGASLRERRQHDSSFSEAFEWALLVSAVLALVQLGEGSHFTSFLDFLPPVLRVLGYNTTNPAPHLNGIFRANGFWFYEPSFLSQFMALGLLSVGLRPGHVMRRVLFVLGLLASFAGTGILVLGAGSIGLLRRMRRTRQVGHGAGVILLLTFLTLLAAGLVAFPQVYADRVAEFSQVNSSAYIRFVAPALYILHLFGSGWKGLMFGQGPGSADALRHAAVMADFAGLPKICFEDGLVAGIFLVVLYARFAYLSGLPVALGLALMFMAFFASNGVYSPVIVSVYLMMGFWGPVGNRPAGVGPHDGARA